IVAALAARPGRRTVISEPGNFPTDLYMLQTAIATLGDGHALQLVPREEVIAHITDDTALVLLTHVHYKTADVHDMAAVTKAAQDKGAMVLWDLSHSVGALPIQLNACDADLAVGCGYKFLNGGPGAPAFLFVAERHHATLVSPLGGWMGHARPFAFTDQYEPADGIARFLCGTPPIVAVAGLECGVDLHLEADMTEIARKSRAMAELFIAMVQARCGEHDVTLVGPPSGAPRGSHVSFRHAHGYAIMQALIARGVIGDFRAPDIMRFGLTPLYLRYADIAHAVDVLEDVLRTNAWRAPEYQVRQAVT
ncbi:MAG TPA: aminotransferase class V-fold PLP-dependent enzyme, partial [Gemmatimonas sp.]|uniref:kynureninase n=1 Tax=Gemmatimonas sp. TaxID=1962908 RepID=UPI002EDA2738